MSEQNLLPVLNYQPWVTAVAWVREFNDGLFVSCLFTKMADHEQKLIAALNESGHFQHLQTLGKGSFGYVVRASRSTAGSTQGAGETLAIKLLPRAEVSGDEFVPEVYSCANLLSEMPASSCHPLQQYVMVDTHCSARGDLPADPYT